MESTTGKYYTFNNARQGDATWSAPQQSGEPVYVEAHIIEPERAGGWSTAFVNASIPQQPGASSGNPTSTAGGGGRVAGAVQTVVGLGIAAIGVPMLLLPGPGLLTIAGGLLVAGSGAKKLLFGKQR